MSLMLTEPQSAEQLAEQLLLDNRTRLANSFARILFAIGSLYVLAFNLLLFIVTAARQPIFFVVDAIIILAVSGWFITLTWLRSSTANLIATLIVVSFFLAITALLVSFSAVSLLQPLLLTGLAAYLLIIIVAGLLGTNTLVIMTTILTNIAALLLLINEVRAGQIGFTNQFVLLGPQILAQQWAAAGFIIILARFSRGTLRQLSNSLLAIDQARKLDELKNQFISSVNHELRNPIMTLQGLIEVIYRGLKSKLDFVILEDLAQRADRVGDGLRQLVLSILEVRQIGKELQELQPALTELSTVITSAAEAIPFDELNPTERELRLRIPPHLAVWADPIRLQQVIVNLLSNGMKYSERGTPIEISAAMVISSPAKAAKATSLAPPMIELRFRDYGFGIPPAEIPLLFNRFVRLPRDLASNITGNGLGLFLCKELVEAMGGAIWVESTGVPGQGSTFFVRLPVAPGGE